MKALWTRISEETKAYRHRRRRQRKKLERLEKCDVVFLSWSKSGRTWLNAMISRVYSRKYGLPENDLINFDNFHKLNPAAPRVFFTHDESFMAWNRRSRGGLVARLAGKKLIFLVRDPRDVVVSYYFQLAKREPEKVRLAAGLPSDMSGMTIAEFALREPFAWLPRIIAFMNTWAGRLQRVEQKLMIRYEDMRAEPSRVLAETMAFLGESATEAEIDEAVAFASFESLAQKERSGFFVTERLRTSDPNDPTASKVRKGKVGGFTEYFTADELQELNETARRLLSPVFEAYWPVETAAAAQ